LTDLDPLVVIMEMVPQEFEGKSFDDSKVRKASRRVIQELQADTSLLEHNKFIPRRRCKQAFEPVVDDKLLTRFLAWHESGDTQDLIAIHQCPACGGQIGAKQIKLYYGDFHTPEPGTIDDDTWASSLLEHSNF
jgi:hypothetical protein